MLILGIDPGTAITGYGVIQAADGADASLVECGVVRTSARAELPVRLEQIFNGISELIERHHPDCMSIEDVFYARSVRATVVLGHARGVILLAARRAGMPVFEYPPTEIKKSVTGSGAATKEQVQFMVAQLLNLASAPEPNDAADGVAAALAHVQAARLQRLLSGETESRRQAG